MFLNVLSFFGRFFGLPFTNGIKQPICFKLSIPRELKSNTITKVFFCAFMPWVVFIIENVFVKIKKLKKLIHKYTLNIKTNYTNK